MTSPKRPSVFKHKHLLGLEHLTADEIIMILDSAAGMKEIFTRTVKKVPTLRGKLSLIHI